MNKKKILWVGDLIWANSGMGIQNKIVVTHLCSLGHKVSYLAWFVGEAGQKTSYKLNNNNLIDIYYAGAKSFGSPSLITEILEIVKPDIIISLGDIHMVLPLTMLDQEWRTKWVHWWTVDSPFLPESIVQATNLIPRIIALTRFGADTIHKYTGREVPIIGHACDLVFEISQTEKVEAKTALKIKTDDIVFGCVAKNFWRKNISILIKAFAAATSGDKKVKLLLHTSSDYNDSCDIHAITKELKLGGKILLSEVDTNREELSLLYNAMDYHILTSYGEGFGVPIIESMAKGVPNIAPNNTTFPEIIRGSGFIVPLSKKGVMLPSGGVKFFPPDFDKLVQTIKDAIILYRNNKKQYAEKSRAAINIAKKYSISSMVHLWQESIDNFNKLAAFKPSDPVISIKHKFSSKKPKILLCSMFYVPNLLGGGEITVKEFMLGLKARGWDCKVLTMFDGIKGQFRAPLPHTETVVDGITVVESGEHWYEYLVQCLENDPPDVLLTYEIFGWYSLRFLREAKKHGIKTVMYEQFWRLVTTTFDKEIISQLPDLPRDGVQCSNLSDLLIANSEYMHDVFVRFLGRNCPVVFPPMSLGEKKKNTGKYITMLNPGKAKGSNTFFYLAEHLPNEHFRMVGAISEDETYLNLKKYPNVAYTPHTDNMEEIYHEAKVVIFPSIVCESFGRTPIEAMSYGVPVIARAVGAVEKNLENACIVIPSSDSDEVWLKELSDLLKSKAKFSKVANSGYKLAHSKFEKTKQLDVFDSLLKALIKDKTKNIAFEQVQKPKILSICDNGFISVSACLEYAEFHFKNKLRHIKLPDCQNSELLIDTLQNIDIMQAKVIVYGGWCDKYEWLRKKIKMARPHVSHIINWHSPLGQMEMGNEIGSFVHCSKLLNTQEIDHIIVPFKKDADLFKNTYNANYRWFPDTMIDIACEPAIPKDKCFKIGFFALPSFRKNILAQLSAVRMLHLALKNQKNDRYNQVKLFIGNGFDRYRDYTSFLNMLSIPYQLLPHFSNKQEYYSYLGSMDLNLQVTYSEAFNYVCAESMALGVPCLGSLMTPALTSSIEEIKKVIEKLLIVDRIDDVYNIFSKMLFFAFTKEEVNKEFSKIWQIHIRNLIQEQNNGLKLFFDEMYEKYLLE